LRLAGYCPQVSNAISRTQKKEIVTNLKAKLDTSAIVFGMRFKGLSVRRQHSEHLRTAAWIACPVWLAQVATVQST
jgi:hypothetical protein